MAYDENLAERVRLVLRQKRVLFEEKKMMGGLCFMVNDKMLLGLLTDKSSQRPLIMARVGEETYHEALQNLHVSEMNFTGRSMKGFVFVNETGFDLQDDLENWIQLCLDYNPKAKKSKKRSKS